MKVSEAVTYMTKSYLHRTIDSFTRDLPKPDEEKAREIIIRNAEELTDSDRIETVLSYHDLYSERLLHTYILEALINRPNHAADETDVIDEVRQLEEGVIQDSKNPERFKYEDADALDILRAVLEVAIRDERVSSDELGLLRRLREKLGIQNRTARVLQAELGHFPKAGNRIHSPSEFRDALIDLQRRGVVFYCNKLDGGIYVVPDEIVPGVRRALGIELSRKGWHALLQQLPRKHFATILEAAGLPKYGSKQELQERVVAAGIRPSSALDSLSNEDLYQICKSLPGAKVSGSKSDRIDRVIDYFANLVVRELPEEASPGERYYRYLVELAHRDRENLLANKVIKKDRDMEDAFEEGTRYLFTEKLGLELLHMPGSEHPDGSFEMRSGGDLLLWDNKSKETVYSFPQSHVRQFKRYIRDSDRRVSCFLIIAPEIDDGAAAVAARLKVESRTDTDIALISAEDLLWVAEQWSQHKSNRPFDPEVFNITGLLDRQTLEQRMRIFL